MSECELEMEDNNVETYEDSAGYYFEMYRQCEGDLEATRNEIEEYRRQLDEKDRQLKSLALKKTELQRQSKADKDLILKHEKTIEDLERAARITPKPSRTSTKDAEALLEKDNEIRRYKRKVQLLEKKLQEKAQSSSVSASEGSRPEALLREVAFLSEENKKKYAEVMESRRKVVTLQYENEELQKTIESLQKKMTFQKKEGDKLKDNYEKLFSDAPSSTADDDDAASTVSSQPEVRRKATKRSLPAQDQPKKKRAMSAASLANLQHGRHKTPSKPIEIKPERLPQRSRKSSTAVNRNNVTVKEERFSPMRGSEGQDIEIESDDEINMIIAKKMMKMAQKDGRNDARNDGRNGSSRGGSSRNDVVFLEQDDDEEEEEEDDEDTFRKEKRVFYTAADDLQIAYNCFNITVRTDDLEMSFTQYWKNVAESLSKTTTINRTFASLKKRFTRHVLPQLHMMTFLATHQHRRNADHFYKAYGGRHSREYMKKYDQARAENPGDFKTSNFKAALEDVQQSIKTEL